MIVLIDKSFEKDVKSVKDRKILNSIADIIEEIQNTEKLTDIPNCKKLKGSSNAFRIRLGNYRIGFVFEDNQIKFIRFLHRSKIYDYFPD